MSRFRMLGIMTLAAIALVSCSVASEAATPVPVSPESHDDSTSGVAAMHKTGPAAENPRLLTEADSGSSVTVSLGQELILNLKEVPTAGYQWKIIECDEKRLALSDLPLEDRTADPRIVGGSSRRRWRIRPLAPGTARLIMRHVRPWEGPRKDSWTFDLMIVVGEKK